MKKSGFKPSHNKRKINDNANQKISIKNKKVIQNARKYLNYRFENVLFLGKNISSFVFHKWLEKIS